MAVRLTDSIQIPPTTENFTGSDHSSSPCKASTPNNSLYINIPFEDHCCFCHSDLPRFLSPKLQGVLDKLLLPANSFHSPLDEN
jgi:hypothetical protein